MASPDLRYTDVITGNQELKPSYYYCYAILPGGFSTLHGYAFQRSLIRCLLCHLHVEVCILVPAPVDGAWSQWSLYGPCTHACLGIAKRTRTCTDPAPVFGGSACEGINKEEKICNDCVGNVPPFFSLFHTYYYYLFFSIPINLSNNSGNQAVHMSS